MTLILKEIQKKILEKKGFLFDEEFEKLNLKDKKKEEEKLEKFLYPNWERDLGDWKKIKNIYKVVERIKKAIDENEKIVIYSDYDCDGIPGAVIMHDFFKKIEAEKNKKEKFKIDFINYIPHRHKEGYGLNKKAIEKFIAEGYTLLITIDLGITNFQEIELAEKNNLNIILTDHHLPLEEKQKQIFPEAFAIINTKQKDCEYSEKYLCGCSTIWKVIHAFLENYREEYNVVQGWEKWLLDMVAISTVADLVPLENENRLFVRYGIEVLKKTKREGFLKMLNNSKTSLKNFNEDDIGFAVAPRLNSASRMEEPIHAFYTLLQNKESLIYADELEKYNTNRKKDTKEAHLSIDFESLKYKNIIFIGDKKWNIGVLGLIASKVVDETGKTCFVYGGDEGNIFKGSCRAGKDNLNVVEIMTKGKEFLENYGGHEKAGGFSIQKENIKKFEEFLNTTFGWVEDVEIEKKEVGFSFDVEIELKDINKNLLKDLEILKPFGIGNEKPIFKMKNKNLKIEFKKFGKEKEHLEILFRDENDFQNKVRGIIFFVREKTLEDFKNQEDFYFYVEYDSYKDDVCIKLLK